MLVHRIAIASVVVTLLMGYSFGDDYSTVTIRTQSGHETEAWVYQAKSDETQEIAIVFLHGKRGHPEVKHNSRFIAKMRKAGYLVVAPLMPWSAKNGYAGTREQGMEIIDAAAAATGSDRVVVIGHSMGGVAVLQYGSMGKRPSVIGLVSVAFGHDPNRSSKLRDRTQAEAEQACRLTDSGQGKKVGRYPEMNTGKHYEISATAEYYCSYYAVDRYPESLKIAAQIDTPLYIVSGDSDRLTKVYGHTDVYAALPPNAKHRHERLPGEHKDVLYENTDAIDSWIKSL